MHNVEDPTSDDTGMLISVDMMLGHRGSRPGIFSITVLAASYKLIDDAISSPGSVTYGAICIRPQI